MMQIDLMIATGTSIANDETSARPNAACADYRFVINLLANNESTQVAQSPQHGIERPGNRQGEINGRGTRDALRIGEVRLCLSGQRTPVAMRMGRTGAGASDDPEHSAISRHGQQVQG